MKNTFRTLLASTSISVPGLAMLGFAILGGALPATANDGEPLHVKVPFAFRAGKTTLPAGEYAVYSEDSNIIMIKGTGGNAILLGSATEDVAPDKSGISFERDANGYCLKSVHVWGKSAATRIADGPVIEK